MIYLRYETSFLTSKPRLSINYSKVKEARKKFCLETTEGKSRKRPNLSSFGVIIKPWKVRDLTVEAYIKKAKGLTQANINNRLDQYATWPEEGND